MIKKFNLEKLLIILIPAILLITLFSCSIADIDTFTLNLAFVKSLIYKNRILIIIICCVSMFLEILICTNTSKQVRNIFTCINFFSLIIGINALIYMYMYVYGVSNLNIDLVSLFFITLLALIAIFITAMFFIIRNIDLKIKYKHLSYDKVYINIYCKAILIIIAIVIAFSISYAYDKKIAYEKVVTIVNSEQTIYEKYKNIFETTDALFLANFSDSSYEDSIPDLYLNTFSIRESGNNYNVEILQNEILFSQIEYNIEFREVCLNRVIIGENNNIIKSSLSNYTNQEILDSIDQLNQYVFNEILNELK